MIMQYHSMIDLGIDTQKLQYHNMITQYHSMINVFHYFRVRNNNFNVIEEEDKKGEK